METRKGSLREAHLLPPTYRAVLGALPPTVAGCLGSSWPMKELDKDRGGALSRSEFVLVWFLKGFETRHKAVQGWGRSARISGVCFACAVEGTTRSRSRYFGAHGVPRPNRCLSEGDIGEGLAAAVGHRARAICA